MPQQRPSDVYEEIYRYRHVVGVARNRDDDLVVLLDADDRSTRLKLEGWARARNIHFVIKVVGPIVTS